MDSISISIFVIVLFIIIFGILVWIIIAKNKDRRYDASGEVIFNNTSDLKDSTKLKNDASNISKYIDGDVVATQNNKYGGELTFKHNEKDIKIITPENIFSEYPIIVVDGISFYKYSTSVDPTIRVPIIYKEFVTNNGHGFVTESEYEELKTERLNKIEEDKKLKDQKLTISSLPFIITISNIDHSKDTFPILQDTDIGILINDYILRHSRYHFTDFIYNGVGFLSRMEKSAKDLRLDADSIIYAVGFKIMHSQKEMIKYIKSITVKDTQHAYNISKNKIVVTLNSGSFSKCIRWHYENKDIKWDWEFISNKVFSNKLVRMYVSENKYTGPGYNEIIFYHEQYLQSFADCLQHCGLTDYTPDILLSIVKVFFNKTDPGYTTNMTIINVLFGDYTGEGHIEGALAEAERDQIVMKSYELYLHIDSNTTI